VTTSPTSAAPATPPSVVSVAVLVAAIAGVRVITVVVLSGGDTVVPPPGSEPVAVAVFTTWPASTSAWVSVCVPVQVVVAPGASVVAGQVAGASSRTSSMTRPVIVTLPVLVTTKLYGIVEPAVLPLGVPAILSSARPGWADTVTVATAVSQFVGFSASQIEYG
jgi:hypothetical protein